MKKTDKPVGRRQQVVYADTDNEQLIIAAMLQDRLLLQDLSITLSPNLFIGERHKTIFRILADIAAQRLKFDHEVFTQLGKGKNYGKRKYIEDLIEHYPGQPKNINFHTDKLRIDATKHSLRTGAFQKLQDLSENPKATLIQIQECIQLANAELSGVAIEGAACGDPLYESYLADWKARRKAGNFTPTGYAWFDESLTEGLARKKISIWTARTSIGKSTLVSNIADRIAARHGVKVMHFPIEMDTISVLDCIVSSRIRISLDDIIKNPHKLSKEKLLLINKTARDITRNGNLSFWRKGLAFEQIYNVIRQGGFQVAVFDLWERLVPRVDASTISEYLYKTQQLAKDSDCHFMLVHQTRRFGSMEKKRSDKGFRPTLESLKNSGAYEEVADLVIGLYREAYYRPEVDDILEVEILKQRRGGRLNKHYYKFEGQYGLVGDEVRNFQGFDDLE